VPPRLQLAREERNAPLPAGSSGPHLRLDRPRQRSLDDILGSRNLTSPFVVLSRLFRVVYATIDD
jgi:hypothetical protein